MTKSEVPKNVRTQCDAEAETRRSRASCIRGHPKEKSRGGGSSLALIKMILSDGSLLWITYSVQDSLEDTWYFVSGWIPMDVARKSTLMTCRSTRPKGPSPIGVVSVAICARRLLLCVLK